MQGNIFSSMNEAFAMQFSFGSCLCSHLMTFGSYAYKINLIPKLIFLNFRFFLKKLRLDAVKKKKKWQLMTKHVDNNGRKRHIIAFHQLFVHDIRATCFLR
jgi:hypothetical protein